MIALYLYASMLKRAERSMEFLEINRQKSKKGVSFFYYSSFDLFDLTSLS